MRNTADCFSDHCTDILLPVACLRLDTVETIGVHSAASRRHSNRCGYLVRPRVPRLRQRVRFSLPIDLCRASTTRGYSGATRYEMAQLLRAFLLKEIHGWTHETALVKYLN